MQNDGVQIAYLKIQWRLVFANLTRCSNCNFEWVILPVSKIETTSKVSVKPPSRINLWMHAEPSTLDTTHKLPHSLERIKEINRLRKETNRLLKKRNSNIYWKVTIEKNWRSQNFDFLSLKNMLSGQFFESSISRRYHWISKLLLAT